MSARYPDTISVRVTQEEEIVADSADITLSISGSSFFVGNDAFKKAKEVKTFVRELEGIGIDASQLSLRSVAFQSQSIAIAKASSVNYVLKVSKIDLEKLSGVLTAIFARKQIELNELHWNYASAKETYLRLRSLALNDAIHIARQDAEILGVDLLGVHELAEEGDMHSRRSVEGFDGALAAPRSRSARAPIDLGMVIASTMMLAVALNVAFRISPMRSK